MKKTILIAILVPVVIFALYQGNAYMESKNTVDVKASTSTTTYITDMPTDVEKARKQLEEATNKLNAEEQKILADTEQASTTAHAQIAEILAKYNAVKAENDKKLDEINSIRSSF